MLFITIINLLNYTGEDIFTEVSNNNNLSININDIGQINGGNNSLKDNNVTIINEKGTPTKISLTLIMTLLITSVVIYMIIKLIFL